MLGRDYAAQPTFLFAWGRKGGNPGEFYSPISLAFNKNDELFVTDLNNARVQKFTADGVFLRHIHLPLDKAPRNSTILGGMAIDDEGLIFLSFMVQNKIAVYTETGQLIREWGRQGSGDGTCGSPAASWSGPATG